MRKIDAVSETNNIIVVLRPLSTEYVIFFMRSYTKYGEIGTATLGRYKKSGPVNGTLDINILGQVGHKSPFSH